VPSPPPISARAVTVIYLAIVVGLGRVPTDHGRIVLLVSMVAVSLSPLVHLPARQRLTGAANRLVYGEERYSAEALDTFCSRLTRALPMDELLLQLVELCKKHLSLKSAEVWTGVDNRLVQAASVPDRGPADLQRERRRIPL
jgi:hypothetical protein